MHFQQREKSMNGDFLHLFGELQKQPWFKINPG